MKIKLFVSLSILYIVLLAAATWHFNNANYTLDFGQHTITLPVAIWVSAPVLLFFVLALLHICIYGLLRHFRYRHFFDDAEKFEGFICELLLEKEPKTAFKTAEFKNAAELAKALKTHKKSPNFAKLNEIIDALNALKEGKGVNLRKFKLDENNILRVKNEQNLIANDANYAFSCIKNKREFEGESDLAAFESVLKNGTYEQISSLKLVKNQTQRLGLIERFSKGTLELTGVDFEDILGAGGFDESDYLKAAKLSHKKFNPDALIAIFKRLKNAHPDALRAYLYILAEFSLFDELAKELGTDKRAFADFRLVLLAREKNLKIDLDKFIL